MKKILLILLMHFSIFINAQNGTVDTSFNQDNISFGDGSGAGGTTSEIPVTSISLQNDGKIIISGGFRSYNGFKMNRVARLNVNGSLDTSFSSIKFTSDGDQYLAVGNNIIQPDGKILFTSDKTIVRHGIDGAYDYSFSPAGGALSNGSPSYNSINSIVLQNDGKLIVGGYFYKFNGIPANGIIRLESDGTYDPSFKTSAPGTLIKDNNIIKKIKIQPDGKILVVGTFIKFDNVSRNNIVRLNTDGTVDATFAPLSGSNDVINDVAMLTDGKFIVVGKFTTFDGTAANGIARLNANGTIDKSFNSDGVVGFINTLSIQANNQIIIGGEFSKCNNVVRNNIARLNADGSLDTTVNYNLKTEFYSTFSVNAITIQPDNKILIGGRFEKCNNTRRYNIARLNIDGSVDTSFNYGNNATVQTTDIQSDGKIIIGGDFASYNDVNANNLARLNSDGKLDTNFKPAYGEKRKIEKVLIQADNKILVLGDYPKEDSSTDKRIVRLNNDGSLDLTFNCTYGTYININSMALQSDGKIVVVNDCVTGFTPNSYTSGIVRFNKNGSLDQSFSGIGWTGALVRAVAIQQDGKIIIGGNFDSVTGKYYNLARLNPDGSQDKNFDTGITLKTTNYRPEGVRAIAIQPDGKIVVGGGFLVNINGIYAKYDNIVRFNVDGSVDASFKPSSSGSLAVNSIAIQPNGKIIVGGLSNGRMTVLNKDGSVDESFSTGSGLNGPVYTISLLPDNNIIAGGRFTTYNGTTKCNIVKILYKNNPLLPSYVPSDCIIGWYPFNSSGNDESGNEHHGMLYEGATYTTDMTGKPNSALYLEGNYAFFQANIPSVPLANSPRTISGWFKTDTPNFNKYSEICVFNYGKTSKLQRFSLCINSKGYLETVNGSSFLNEDDFYINNNNYINNNWYFFTITYDGTKISLYINGVYVSSKSVNLNTASSDFRLGNRIEFDGIYEYFKGTIDDVGIWNCVLSQEKITGLYNSKNLGLKEISQNRELTFYPNPTNDYITIDCGDSTDTIGWSVKIYSILGQEVFNGVMDTSKYTIPLNTCGGQGVYFLKIFDQLNDLKITKKIILK